MTTTEPTTVKRLTPAGQGACETEWSSPDLAHREGWLSEARSAFHANKDRRAAEAWGKCMQAQRVIRLVKAVDERDELLDERRRQIADALREREALEARCAQLQRTALNLQTEAHEQRELARRLQERLDAVQQALG